MKSDYSVSKPNSTHNHRIISYHKYHTNRSFEATELEGDKSMCCCVCFCCARQKWQHPIQYFPQHHSRHAYQVSKRLVYLRSTQVKVPVIGDQPAVPNTTYDTTSHHQHMHEHAFSDNTCSSCGFKPSGHPFSLLLYNARRGARRTY